MKSKIQWLTTRHFWRDTRGQDLIEYALMAGFIAVAAVVFVPALTTSIGNLFDRITAALDGISPA
jgi:pilus assembly protein Flp/PilA